MIERDDERFIVVCWGCGEVLEYIGQLCPDPDCRERGVISDPKPKMIMPFCGEKPSSLLTEPLTERCCRCGKNIKWNNYDHWLQGPCPHCGAKGMNGTV